MDNSIDTATGDTTDGEKRSIGLMKRAKYGIFGQISRSHRQYHGADEYERVRLCKVDLGPEISAAETRLTDYPRLRHDLRHRSIRQRGHLHRHQTKSCHANRHQLLSVQSSSIRPASLDSR